ncbi:hypothetical protein WICPIJ_000601 [Wickerhamomyces pijperi]|uniref:Transmembrane protein n=1 Tax=Wickerhamomyces pijperi TaxID=599730 RepID=A0A9P8QDA7_WICPI|nr:hypothetical protein WICPIJ_000601 [Wickerhamomyces pijperi]
MELRCSTVGIDGGLFGVEIVIPGPGAKSLWFGCVVLDPVLGIVVSVVVVTLSLMVNSPGVAVAVESSKWENDEEASGFVVSMM